MNTNENIDRYIDRLVKVNEYWQRKQSELDFSCASPERRKQAEYRATSAKTELEIAREMLGLTKE